MDLSGAIDLHVHTAPDVYPRSVDDHQQIEEAGEVGMRAVLLKSHHTLTADRGTLAGSRFSGGGSPAPGSGPGPGIEAFGGVVLNETVGGLNPVAVETAIQFGARQVWMPTLHAAHCMAVASPGMFRSEARRFRERGRSGITVLDDSGGLDPKVDPILELVRDAGIAIGTGHLSPREGLAVLKRAHRMGIDKLVVTHPLMPFCRYPGEYMERATRLGAKLELDYLSCSPHWKHAAHDPAAHAAVIRRIGARHCILATDGGQPFNPHPAVMLRDFAHALSHHGVTDANLRTMLCDNPAKILGV